MDDEFILTNQIFKSNHMSEDHPLIVNVEYAVFKNTDLPHVKKVFGLQIKFIDGELKVDRIYIPSAMHYNDNVWVVVTGINSKFLFEIQTVFDGSLEFEPRI